MSAPIRSAEAVQTIINKGQHAIADYGLEIVRDAKNGVDNSDPLFRQKILKLVLIRMFLQNILNDDGELTNYYDDSANEKKLNNILTGILKLSGLSGGSAIPKLTGINIPLVYYPSSNSYTSVNSEATPGGITFENTNVDAPGEIVDTIDASTSNYAFYIMNVIGTGPGEGTRSCTLLVTWRGNNTPTIAEYAGADVGGSTVGVTFSAAYNAGFIEITANVPTDNWIIRGSRISFYNISFQNLPPNGISGNINYLSKFLTETSIGNSQVFDNGTNVGVGTSIPAGKLDVAVDNSSQTDGNTPFYSNSFNNGGLRTGNAGYATIFGYQNSNDTVTGSNYGTVIGINAFYDGTDWYTKNEYVPPSFILFNNNTIKFYSDAAGTLGTYTPTLRMTLDSNGLNLNSNKIAGLAAASTNGDALRYEQLIGLYLLLTGGTMSGNIAMGNNKVTGLAAATTNGDAVRYEQLSDKMDVDAAYTSTGLSMASGYTNSTLQFKTTGNNTVVLNGKILTPASITSIPTINDTFLTLPVGYRPSVKTPVLLYLYALSAELQGDVLPADINTDGTIISRKLGGGTFTAYSIYFPRIEFEL